MASSFGFKMIRAAEIAACIFIGIAMLLYPGGTLLDPSTRGYSLFNNSLSDLGSSVAWNGKANRLGALLTLGASLLVAGAGFGSLVVLMRVYASSKHPSRLPWVAGALSLAAGAALIGAALSPQDRHPILHSRFTLLAVCLFPVSSALFAVITAQDGRFRKRAALAWRVLTVLIVGWVFVMPWRPTTALQLSIPVTLQKIVAGALLCTLALESYEAERVSKPSSPVN